jgi:hypothetical protein
VEGRLGIMYDSYNVDGFREEVMQELDTILKEKGEVVRVVISQTTYEK